MNISKRAWISCGSVCAVAVLTIATPRAAHGVAAALVQVVNTTANPVPNLDAEKHARIPYQSRLSVSCGVGMQQCAFAFNGAPSGYRLVVENVGGVFLLAAGATQAPMIYFQTSVNWFAIPSTIGQANSGFPTAGVSQAIHFVNDAPTATVQGNFLGGSQTVTLSGYLENCAVTGCPAIAH
jgi:hypothetical protein